MSTTSQKHQHFVSEPMGDKPVTDLAGIGEKIGQRLSDGGFDKAYVVLGQFLVLQKDRERFTLWLKELGQCNIKQANDCFQCLSEWCDQFL
ncbi:barrier to autointegration factor [Brevipalpus obovatus]|uniref:barrier to autointegration factor n=1 Tax=Brevipalpus obovatus TaxID=246614 RepID=UPI003D9FACE8